MSENINMGGEFYSAIIGEKSTGVYTMWMSEKNSFIRAVTKGPATLPWNADASEFQSWVTPHPQFVGSYHTDRHI